MPIVIRLDRELVEPKMTLTELDSICRELDCQPGDLLEYVAKAGDDFLDAWGGSPGGGSEPVKPCPSGMAFVADGSAETVTRVQQSWQRPVPRACLGLRCRRRQNPARAERPTGSVATVVRPAGDA